MSEETLRVAFFPDSYLEINGAALTCRKLADFARHRGYPFLCVHAGNKTKLKTVGNFTDLSLTRSPLSFGLDEDLKYDPFFNRHLKRVRTALEKFRPQVIHLTGLNDVSIIGAILSHQMQIPMLASWHTNLHEFAATRLDKMLNFMPVNVRGALSGFAERKIFDGAVLYYKMPKVILVPNEEQRKVFVERTKREVQLMIRGVNVETFSPEHRSVNDDVFRFGFVGRLRAEKNVRMLADLEAKLLAAGKTNFKILVVGDGSEREWLEKHLQNAEFTGFLEGEQLAEAYANMDVFVFPSETDSFGNVIQEANASGVPAIVTSSGGPKFIVQHGETGFVAKNVDEFAAYSLELMNDRDKLRRMKEKSREFAKSRSWDAVFEKVYEGYQKAYALRSPKMRTEFATAD